MRFPQQHPRAHSFRGVVLLALGVAGVGLTLSQILAKPGANKRIDVPFTLNVKTPHVEWGKPSLGTPIHAFVVPSVSAGRTLVELAERIDLNFDTVMIDEAWDVNTWTVGTDKDYESRNYKLVYQYLVEDLTKPTQYDVIILPSLHGWNRLPQAARDAIRKRVEQGAGLVLIHPTTGIPNPDDPPSERPLNDFAPDYSVAPGGHLWDLSPLIDVLSDRLNNRGSREVRPDAIAPGPWRRASEHFITSNVPFESFPFDYLQHYRYHLGTDSTALVVGANGEPIIATKMYGKGRVVAFGYLNTGLAPRIDWKILGRRDDRWWEYIYSMLCRGIVWASRHETGMRLAPLRISGEEPRRLSAQFDNETSDTSAEVMAEVWNEWGQKEGTLGVSVNLKRGPNSATLDLPSNLSAGLHTVDVILTAEGKHYDWGSVAFELPKPNEIASLSTGGKFFARGSQIGVTVKTQSASPAEVVTELLDNRGRLLSRQRIDLRQNDTETAKAVLGVGNYTTNIGWVRASLLEPRGKRHRLLDRRQVRVEFPSVDRGFGAYELIMPWYGPPSYEPWTPTLDEQFLKMGVTAVEDPTRNFKLIAAVHAPGFGVYWHYRKKYLEQKDNFLETGDTKYLVREPDLASDEWLDGLRGIIRKSMAKSEPYRPLAYYLADESSLTAYGDPLDFSWSEPTLGKFREWLKTQYTGLEALNAEWETGFKSWEDVLPLTTAQAQAKGNYAGWMDHRTFMEQVFANAMRVAADTVRQQDPGGLPSISGTQAPGPSNAVNWYLLDQIVDYLQPYSEDDQDELHRSMHPGQILTGFTGYEAHGKALRYQLWHRLLHGQVGASLFWHYTALNADLTLTEQGHDLADTIDEFRNEGLALLLHGAQRENCGIAVHYSLLSVRGQWITDGHIAPHEVSSGDETSAHLKRFHQNRTAWLQALEDAGYQYDFLTTEQISAGKLADYKVLVLPDSIALSDHEVTAIRKFVTGGGLLISDGETGLMDGHARWQPAGRLDDVLGVQRISMRSAPEDVKPVALPVSVGAGRRDLRVLPVDATLRTTTGRPGAAADGTLMLIDHSFGAGRSISLNFWMGDYEQLRKAGTQRPRLDVLQDYLSRAGVTPVADVRRASGEPLACSEIVAFHREKERFLAVLPEPDCADAGPVSLNLPSSQYVYNLRTHRALGRVRRVNETLLPGEPLLVALLPSPVGELHLAGAGRGPTTVKPGGTVKFSISTTQRSGKIAPASAAHIEVRDPNGKLVDCYGKTVALPSGEGEFSIGLALNDLPGVWQVAAREPYSHKVASATFRILGP